MPKGTAPVEQWHTMMFLNELPTQNTKSPVSAMVSLPRPQQCPRGDVVIYDDHCGLCRDAAQLLERLDGRCRLSFLGVNDPETSERFPQLSRQALNEEVHVLEPNGRQHRGAQAIRYLVRRLPLLWLLIPLLYFPGTLPLWRRLYTLVSHHREQLSRLISLRK